jgi:hypothetical protein
MARLGEVVDDLRGRSFVGRGAEPAGSDDAPAGRSAHRVLSCTAPPGSA